MIQHLHKDPVLLPPGLREPVGRALLATLAKHGATAIVLAVSSNHVHLIVRCEPGRLRAVIGHAKRTSSHAIRETIPGAVWGKKCGVKTIRSHAQQRATFTSIVDHRDEGSWVWRYRDAKP